MPSGDFIFVALLIFAFAVFAIVLGWADHRTRRIGK